MEMAIEHRREIERAIDGVKAAELGRWFRREWYKSAARRRWPKQRQEAWRKRQVIENESL
jgi:hypothetical protein